MHLPDFSQLIQVLPRIAAMNERDSGLLSAAVNNSNPTNMTTRLQLSSQWTNPSDVLSVLLIVGGDVVQKALAQTSGGYFTPVCFSFGWVAYSLNAITGIIGDGRLLPEPENQVKVFNLESGYGRENNHWIIGRILRDNIIRMNRNRSLGGDAIRISIYDALECRKGPAVAGSGRVKYFGFAAMIFQLLVATIPVILYQEWGILMLTGIGTLLALSAGALPQWTAEKFPRDLECKKNFALTAGNGSRDIMVIRGNGVCLDLEGLAALQMPRSAETWETSLHPLLSRTLKNQTDFKGKPVRKTWAFQGIPLGFWITMAVVIIQFVLWLGILITVAGLRSHVWYLLLVGGLGMLQNVTIAAIPRDPEKRRMPLKLVETIRAKKVMDGLMDLEISYKGFGKSLCEEFFPGKLHTAEVDWWNGKTMIYDKKREMDAPNRGIPRSVLPHYAPSMSSQSYLEKSRASTFEQPNRQKLFPQRGKLPATIEPGQPISTLPPEARLIDADTIYSMDRRGLPDESLDRSKKHATLRELENDEPAGKPPFETRSRQHTFEMGLRSDTGASSMYTGEMHEIFEPHYYAG